MKSDRLVLIVVLIAVLGLLGKFGLDAKAASDRALHAAEQHDAMHRSNELRRKRLAYEAHLKRAAYDAAHPEEVARRKAAAAEAVRVAIAERATEAANAREAARVAAVAARDQQAREDRENHPCETAVSLGRDSSDAASAGRTQEAYDAATSGLSYADRCDDSTEKTVSEGYLLSFKAHAEHDLGSGDWRTDFNQANALLVECQTLPGLYGTKVGAQCETQEDNNISWTTHWEMQEQ